MGLVLAADELLDEPAHPVEVEVGGDPHQDGRREHHNHQKLVAVERAVLEPRRGQDGAQQQHPASHDVGPYLVVVCEGQVPEEHLKLTKCKADNQDLHKDRPERVAIAVGVLQHDND